MFKYFHGLLPSVFNNFFLSTTEVHSYHTRQANSYHLPYAHTNIRRFSVKYNGAQTWNEIPLSIRLQPSLSLFKLRLRALILDKSQ